MQPISRIAARPLQRPTPRSTPTVPQKQQRVESLDIFRGIVVLTMIFVNDVAGITDIPWWLKHMPSDADGMTFVDLVFPAFLFIVGLAIPFAISNRLSAGQSRAHIAGHVLIRALGLLIVGVYMVNMDPYAPLPGMLSGPSWNLLVYLGVFLIWYQYPRSADGARHRYLPLQIAGALLLIWLAYMYRAEDNGQAIGMRTYWWGILGLIGWAYLLMALYYLWFRNNITAAVGAVGLLTTLFIARRSGAFDHSLGWLLQYLDIGAHIGGNGSIVAAGLALGLLFFPSSPAQDPASRIRWMIGSGIGFAIAGFWLRPLYGINKVEATPSWCLISSAICCGLYALCYWMVDVKGWKKAFAFARPAGANPLLAYILPSIAYAAFQLAGGNPFSRIGVSGFAGIIRSAVFAFAVLGLTAALARLRIRLKL